MDFSYFEMYLDNLLTSFDQALQFDSFEDDPYGGQLPGGLPGVFWDDLSGLEGMYDADGDGDMDVTDGARIVNEAAAGETDPEWREQLERWGSIGEGLSSAFDVIQGDRNGGD